VTEKQWSLFTGHLMTAVIMVTNSYLLFYASDLRGFNLSHKLEVFVLIFILFI